MKDWRLLLAHDPSEPWPVRFILDGPAWRRGYDLAMDQAENQPAADITNPFGPDRDEFFGFEQGRDDAQAQQPSGNKVQPGATKS